jgi:hypothetical protein
MAMTNSNMNNPTPVQPKEGGPLDVAQPIRVAQPVVTAAQLAEAAKNLAQITPKKDEEAALLDDASKEFEDQITFEAKKAQAILAKENEGQVQESGKDISELIEADAYNMAIPINAGAMYDPDLLKVVLIDKNYVARWGNRNNIRQAQLAANGFKPITLAEVDNPDTLTMFEDAQGHLVYADLVAMKCLKTWYYAGLRRAYLKSKYATNDQEAAKAGAAFAKERLMGELKGSERSYMSMHEGKPIYKPNIGV